ncbi:cold shock domain-containing protein [Aeromonas veronii]
MQGTVKWFSSEKGYGFITSEAGEDHYFNVQSINGASLPSMVIQFSLSQSLVIKVREQSISQLLRKHLYKTLGLLMTESTAQVVIKKLFLDSLLIEAAQKSRFAPIVLQQ